MSGKKYIWNKMESNITWLKKYIELANGLPSLSTIGRLFNIINPQQFEKNFIHWMKGAIHLPEKDIISIDGKTMRGSEDKGKGKKGIHKRIAFNAVKNDTKKYPKESMRKRRFIALMNFEYRDFLMDLNLDER